jgi:4'-phosphopantetheinyl transferase
MSILLPLKPLPGLPEPLWLPAPERPDLPANELHIWRAQLEEPRWSAIERGCPVSRDRADRLKAALFRKDILERYMGVAEEGAGFPRVVKKPAAGLRMAVAHCDHLALIAVSRDVRGVGLDLERVRADIPIEEMAGGFLDVRAQWDLRVTWCLQEKAWKFFQFWTSNEACAQARPSSLSSHACQVRGFSPEADFIAALAVEGGPEAELVYWDWNC